MNAPSVGADGSEINGADHADQSWSSKMSPVGALKWY